MPTTPANPSIFVLQRIEDTVPVLDSFVPFAHLVMGHLGHGQFLFSFFFYFLTL